MIDGQRIAEALVSKLRDGADGHEGLCGELKRMRLAVIPDVLAFIDALHRQLRQSGLGSLQWFFEVNADATCEVRLHVIIRSKSRVFKFGVNGDRIHIGGQRAKDLVSRRDAVVSQEELITWLSDEILRLA